MQVFNPLYTSPILRQLDPANCLTIFGLIVSLASALFSIQHQFYAALVAMMLAGMIDLFDGLVARKISRTELQAAMGQQLDSIVDVCSFGFNPAIFAYCFGLQAPLHLAILGLYIAATALRLAYFSCRGLTHEGDTQYFTGMPVTYAALFIPLVLLLNFFLAMTTMKVILSGLYLLLAVAMVANMNVVKLRGIWYGIFSIGGIVISGFYTWLIFAESL